MSNAYIWNTQFTAIAYTFIFVRYISRQAWFLLHKMTSSSLSKYIYCLVKEFDSNISDG